MRYGKIFPAIALTAMLAYGCGGSSPEIAREAVPAALRADAATKAVTFERKHIRTARMELRADDPAASISAIESLTTNLGGYISSKESRSQAGFGFVAMTIRVPNDNLDPFLKGVRESAVHVDHESIASQEVTEQFVDLDARLRTLKATESEIQKLLEESRERKAAVEEIMSIYQRLIEIRTEVESVQGKLNVLSQQTDLATVSLMVTAVESSLPIANETWQPVESVHASVRFLVRTLQVVANVLIVSVIVVAPCLVIFGTPVWGIFILRRGRKLSHR